MCISINEYWLCGREYRNHLKTTDGINWSPQTSGTVSLLRSVYFVNDTLGWTVGESGTIKKTTNGGSTWTTQSSGTFQTLFSVKFLDANNGYIAGGGGKILNTTDGGLTWTTQNSNATGNLYFLYFTDFNTGYVVGISGVIRKTIITTGLQEVRDNVFNFSPNPVQNFLNISLNTKLKRTTIRITDTEGRMVYSEVGNFVNKTIDVSAISSGIYILEISTDDFKQSSPILIQH
ncbi:MAG: T9SS type A sorting domain-containing protein [Bacteroidetes bacterium]|nr:T9SS type A sorting domain-containing protein [Bacteroidota bacterium]